jgi:hypothetical protein
VACTRQPPRLSGGSQGPADRSARSRIPRSPWPCSSGRAFRARLSVAAAGHRERVGQLLDRDLCRRGAGVLDDVVQGFLHDPVGRRLQRRSERAGCRIAAHFDVDVGGAQAGGAEVGERVGGADDPCSLARLRQRITREVIDLGQRVCRALGIAFSRAAGRSRRRTPGWGQANEHGPGTTRSTPHRLIPQPVVHSQRATSRRTTTKDSAGPDCRILAMRKYVGGLGLRRSEEPISRRGP